MGCKGHFLRGIVWACATLLLSGAVGCGSSGGAKTHQVTGKVTTADGNPVKGASVSFTPTGKGFQAVGQTSDDGTYRLTTNEEGDGAAEGEYVVSVNAADGSTLPVLEKEKEKVSVAGATTIDIKVGPPVPGTATPPETAEPAEETPAEATDNP